MIFRRKNSSDDDGAEDAAFTDDYVDASYVEQLAEDGVFVGASYEPAAEPATPVAQAVMDGADGADETGRLRVERGALIELCLYARDRMSSPAAAERVDARLDELGITSLRPDGESFDPSRHEAAASVPTEDPALHGMVAETEVVGYADRGQVVRPPVVAVYRREPT